MSRSIWKGPYTESSIFKEIYNNKKNNLKQKIVTIYTKNIVIYPIFVGMVFSVYNGQRYTNILINKDMVGYKLGEFLQTRKKAVHNKK